MKKRVQNRPKDLFGNVVKKRKSRLETALLKFDKTSFSERFERLVFLNKIFPKEYWYSGNIESAIILEEVKAAFVNGEFIATMMLSQAFIERKIQTFFESIGLNKEAKKGLKYMIQYAKEHKLIDTFFLKRIDSLRKKRNPFSHKKPVKYQLNLSERIFAEIKGPLVILERDAKNAISLMYEVFITNFRI